jgi:hypothetical protein
MVSWQKMRPWTGAFILLLTLAGCRVNTESGAILTKMPNTSKLTFDGHEYRIVKAQIVAAISDPYWCDKYNKGQGKSISWSISFETKTDDAELSPPNVDFDGIQIDVKNWHDLVGYQTQWKDAINAETDNRYGMTYVFDHQLISNGRVHVTARDRTKFQIVASGQNEEGQRFTIDAPAEFMGIYVRGSENDSDETIRARLKHCIDDVNLVGTPFKLDHKYDSGIRMGKSFYSPATE